LTINGNAFVETRVAESEAKCPARTPSFQNFPTPTFRTFPTP